MPRKHDVVCPNCGWTARDMIIYDLEHFPMCPACHEAELEADYSEWETASMNTWKIWAETTWKEIDPGDVQKRKRGNEFVYYKMEEGNA